MSLEKNLGLVALSIVALSVAATATYSFSAKRTHAGQKDARKTRRAEKVPGEGGLREVLSDDDPRKPDWPLVDVVAVHGLGSKYPASWMKDDTMWLKDLLPDDFPQARILAFVYPSGAFDDPDFVDLRALGGSLLRSIARDRANLRERRKRPLIFIGHSLGGLVIKKALALTQVSNPYVEGDHSYVAEATCGVLFLGTPHFGSQYAGLLWTRLSGIFGGTHSGLVRALQLLAPDLEYLNQDFLAIPTIRKLPQQNLICFYETKGQLFGPVVEEWSACLSIATRVSLNAHHDDMNKFSDREGPYDDLRYCLQRIYDPLMDAESSNKNAYIFAVKINTPGYDLLNFHPSDTWSEQDKKGRISLVMGGSGTSGCLMFQSKTSDEKFAVTFGVHNWEPWEDIATDFGDETAQEIRDSYYGGKRSVWSACDGVRRKFRPLGAGKFLYLTFDEVLGRGRYPAEVMVK